MNYTLTHYIHTTTYYNYFVSYRINIIIGDKIEWAPNDNSHWIDDAIDSSAVLSPEKAISLLGWRPKVSNNNNYVLGFI